MDERVSVRTMTSSYVYAKNVNISTRMRQREYQIGMIKEMDWAGKGDFHEYA